jgi:hypothetical protein
VTSTFRRSRSLFEKKMGRWRLLMRRERCNSSTTSTTGKLTSYAPVRFLTNLGSPILQLLQLLQLHFWKKSTTSGLRICCVLPLFALLLPYLSFGQTSSVSSNFNKKRGSPNTDKGMQSRYLRKETTYQWLRKRYFVLLRAVSSLKMPRRPTKMRSTVEACRGVTVSSKR